MKFPSLVLLAFLLAGCVAPKPLNLPPPPTTRSGLTLDQLRTKSLMLTVGMTEEEVVRVIGLPTTTSIEPFGHNTPNPWTGFVWKYQLGLSSFRAAFQPGPSEGTWRLNNWNWIE